MSSKGFIHSICVCEAFSAYSPAAFHNCSELNGLHQSQKLPPITPCKRIKYLTKTSSFYPVQTELASVKCELAQHCLVASCWLKHLGRAWTGCSQIGKDVWRQSFNKNKHTFNPQTFRTFIYCEFHKFQYITIHIFIIAKKAECHIFLL